MTVDDTVLDYTKIRDAMDLASENLRKKEEVKMQENRTLDQIIYGKENSF